jgi:hypothetical protein
MERTMERFETGISRNNVPNWTLLHAVKELLQNVVYAKTQLGDTISIEHDGTYAIITNHQSGIERSKLLIGESNQRDVEGAPGQYGEGFKMGMLAARRENARCWIETAGFTIKAELEPSAIDPSVDAFVLYVEPNTMTEGTRAHIECSKEMLDEAKSYFAVLQGVDPRLTTVTTLTNEFKGIYTNGVKIADTPAVYGYNFTNSSLMNRDRSTVDMDKVKEETRSLLQIVKSEEVAIQVLKGITEDDSLLEAQAGMYGTHSPSIWKKAIEKLFGKRVALATGTESDTQARYRKFKLIPNLPRAWQYFFEKTLQIYPSNQLRETTVGANKHKKATADENKNLGWAKRLVGLYYADYGKVKVSETVLDEFGTDCWGLYDRTEDVIWLKREILSDKERLFKTLLHETVHRETGAKDNTEEFTRGWEQACWGILNKGKVR